MSKIDQRIVEMSFENHKFEKGIRESKNSLKEFSDALRNSGTGGDFEGLERSVGSVSRSFSALEQIGIGALRRIGEVAVNTGASLVKSLSIDQVTAGLSKYEEKINAVQTMVSAGYGLEAVEDSMENLMWFSDETSYSFADMAGNMSKFISAGVNLQDAERAMQGIASWAAHSGKNAQAASIAMFNLSQAISMGYVDTFNWRSIMNQNMNTVAFKEVAIGIAEVTGAIKKGEVTVQNFDSNLKNKWFTTDVLLKTLEQFSLFGEKVKQVQDEMDFSTAQAAIRYMEEHYEDYADVIETIGFKAFKAAQESKSFTDAINATKDAVSSGWMRTFEIIFGTLDEAKKNFSSLTEVLYELFAAGGEMRNELLFETLRSGWEQFTKEGIKDTTTFGKVLSDVAKEAGVDVDSLVGKYGSMQKAVEENFVTGDMLIETVMRMSSSIENLSEEELLNIGYTEKTRAKLLELRDGLIDGSISADEFAKKIGRKSGLESLFNGLKNSVIALLTPLRAISKAWDQIFPPMTANRLYDIVRSFEDFTKALIMSEETANKIQRTFAGLFAVLDIGWQGVKLIGNAFLELARFFVPVTGGVLDMSASFGDFLVSINQAIKASGLFQYSLLAIKVAGVIVREILRNIVSSVSDFVSGLWYAEKPLEYISNLITKVFSGAVENIKMVSNFITTKFQSALSAVQKFLSGKLGPETSGVFGIILTALKDLINFIAKKATTALRDLGIVVKGLDFNKIASFVTAGVLLLFVNQLSTLTKTINGFVAATTSFVTKLSGKLFGMTTKIKDLALVIGVLSASLYILSSIPWENLKHGLAGLAGAIGLFVVAYAGIQTVAVISTKVLKGQRMAETAFELITLAGGLAIMARALKTISSIKTDDIWEAVGVVMALTAFIGAYQLVLAYASKMAIGGFMSISILGMASGVLLLVGVVKVINGLQETEIESGLRRIEAILTVLAGIQMLFSLAAAIGGGNKLSTSVLGMASGILILLGVIKIINNFDPSEIMEGMIKISFIMAVLSAIQVLFLYAAKDVSGVTASINVLGMAGGLVVMMGLIKLVNLMTQDEIEEGINKIAFMMSIVAALQYLFAVINNIGGGKTTTFILSAIASMVVMVGLISLINIYTPEQLTKGLATLLGLGVIIGGIQILFGVAAKIGGGEKATAAVLSTTILLAAMGGIIAMLSIIPTESLQAASIAMLNGAIAIAGLITALTFFSTTADGSIGKMIGLAASMVIFGAAITIMTIPLIELSKLDIVGLMVGVAALAALVGVFAGVGVLFEHFNVGVPSMLSLAASLVIFGAALTIMSVPLIALSLFDTSKIRDVAIVLGSLVAAFALLGFLDGKSGGSLAAGMLSAAAGIAAFGASLILIAGAITLAGLGLKFGAEAFDILITAFGKLLDVVSKNKDTLVEDFTILGAAIASGIFSGITTFFGKIGESLNGVWNKIITSVKQFFGINSPSTVMSEVGLNIAQGLLLGIVNGAKNVVDGAKNMATRVINSVKGVFDTNSPSRVFTTIGGWCTRGLADGIESETKSATDAATRMALDTENATRDALGVNSLSDIWANIGGFLPQSLSAGMEGQKDKLLTAAKNMGIDTGNFTLDGIKETIANGDSTMTSALTGVMAVLSGNATVEDVAEAFGVKVGQDVVDGTKKGLSDESTGLSKTVKTELEKLQSVLDEAKFYGRLSLDQELKAYENLRATVKLTAEDSKKVNREIYQLNKQIHDAQMSYINSTASARKEANNKREAQEKQYQQNITNIEKNAEAERKRTREEYARNQTSINEKLLADIDAQNKAYENAVKSRADAIYNSYGLFSAVGEDEEVTGDELLQNLRDQGAALSDWEQSLDVLKERGVGDALIEELQKMGPASKAQIKALITLTDEQLQEYVGLFEGKYAFARIKAETELEGLKASTTQAIIDLNAQAAIDLDALEVEFKTTMTNINAQMSADLEELKISYKQALRDIKKDLSSNLSDLADTFNSAMRNVTGLTEEQYSELVKQNNLQLTTLGKNSEASMANLEGIYAKSGTNIANTFTTNLGNLNSQSSKNLSTLNTNTASQLVTTQSMYDKTGDQIVLGVDKDGKQIISDADKNANTLNKETDKTLDSLSRNISSDLKSIVKDFEVAGYNAAVGFANGIDKGVYLAVNAAKTMASAAKSATQKALDEHSPSKVFESIGHFVSLGFANGIMGSTDEVEDASTRMAKNSIAVVSQALADLYSELDKELEWEPVITPIMDLSKIQSNGIDRLLGTQSFAQASTRLANETIQNGTRESVPYTSIVNHITIPGMVIRSEADVDMIATKLYQKQQGALRGRGIRTLTTS